MKETIKEIVDKLFKYKEAYYNGTPLVSDEEFDFEENKLKLLDPDNKYFNKVGYKVTNNESYTVEHKIPMLSMQKVKTVEDANNWFYNIIKTDGLKFENQVSTSLYLEPKIDGISGSITYDKDGNLEEASTRGDGYVGASIANAHMIPTAPKKYIPGYELRGEFYISKKYKSAFDNAPLRNACTGLLKKKTDFEDKIHMVSFMIYDSLDQNGDFDFKDRIDKIEKIEKKIIECGNTEYKIVPVIKSNNIKKVYDKYLNTLRDEWEYETDGLVMTIDGGRENYECINSKYTISSHNKYNMALKPPSKCEHSKIVGFTVDVNKTGKISPVAIINPVIIDSVKIERASLYNFEYISKNNIGIGSTVLIQRSNDVIPKIAEVYNEISDNVKPFKIKVCPSCKTPLERYGKDLICTNFNGCKSIYKSKILNFLNILGIKNIGPSIIINIIDSFIRREIPLYISSFIQFVISDNMKTEILDENYNRGSLKFTNIKRELDSVLNNISELDLIVSFCIPLVGEKLLVKNKIYSCQDILKYHNELIKSNIENTAFDSAVIKFFSNKINKVDFEKSIKLLKPYFKSKSYDNGFKICISGEILGKTREDVISEIYKSGNTFVKSVTRDIDFLISSEESTSKVLKAMKYNVKILSYAEFRKQFL